MGTDSSAQQIKRRGFSLVEAAIVLAVVGLVLGGIWVAAAAMYENYKVNKTVQDIFFIASNIQNSISIKDANTLLSLTSINSLLIASKAVPSDWIKNENLETPYGTNFKVLSIPDGGFGMPARFNMVLYNIKKSSCIGLLTRISADAYMARKTAIGSANALSTLGFVAVSPNNSVDDGAWNWYAANISSQITPSTASNACSVDKNRVTFTFGYTRIN